MAAVATGAIRQTVEQAWAAHERPLFRHLFAITRDESTAEDLTQEAFLRYTREVVAGRTPDNAGGWLFRVGANLATSRGRRNQVAERKAPALAAYENDRSLERSPEDVVTDREQSHWLAEALGGLRDLDRQIILLAAHGYRGPEIAERLGRSQAATRTLLCRARMRLRDNLLAAGITA
jgi:RNA polymerase sigma-70 factor (ECF subfamily)